MLSDLRDWVQKIAVGIFKDRSRPNDLLLFSALFSVLLLFAVYFGYGPLSRIDTVRLAYMGEVGAIDDARDIMEATVSLAQFSNPFGNHTYGGGPFRYFLLWPIFVVLQPTLPTAIKLGNAITATVDFVLIPGLIALLVYRHTGRTAALLTVCALFIGTKGILALAAPIIPHSMIIVGPEHYYDGQWQHVYGFFFLLVSILLLDNFLQSKEGRNYNLWSVCLGLSVGVTGGIQYGHGLVAAVVVTIGLLYSRKIKALMITGLTAGVFVPISLIPEAARYQALSTGKSGRLFQFSLSVEPIIIVLLLLIVVPLLASGKPLSENRIFEVAISGTAVVIIIYSFYFNWIATYIFYSLAIAGVISASFTFLKTHFSGIKALDKIALSRLASVAIGGFIGLSIAAALFIALL